MSLPSAETSGVRANWMGSWAAARPAVRARARTASGRKERRIGEIPGGTNEEGTRRVRPGRKGGRTRLTKSTRPTTQIIRAVGGMQKEEGGECGATVPVGADVRP